MINDLSLQLPDGTPLVAASEINIGQGQNWLIRGPSGSGKSTLFRALAGIWPFGSGRIRLPGNGRILFLPQKPYLPIGSLRDVTSYPASDGGFSDEAISQALTDVGLGRLAQRLDEQENWSMQLSPGEQQRMAFARALLQRPDWLLLDEATASLDETAERELYQMLKEKLPQTTVVSVGHRSTLQAFHSRLLEIRDAGGGARLLAPA